MTQRPITCYVYGETLRHCDGAPCPHTHFLRDRERERDVSVCVYPPTSTGTLSYRLIVPPSTEQVIGRCGTDWTSCTIRIFVYFFRRNWVLTTMTNSINQPTLKPRNSFKMLDGLEPGESVLLPMDRYDSLSMCIMFRQRRDNKKFARRLDGAGVRVFRTA